MAQNGDGRKKRATSNILITSTPRTGKTTTSAALSEATNLRHINIGDLVKEKNLHDGWDEELECYVINEDFVSKYCSTYSTSINKNKVKRIMKCGSNCVGRLK